MIDRTTAALSASTHPLVAIIPAVRVHQEMEWKRRTVEYDLSTIEDAAFASQVDQAIDRVALLDGIAEERAVPVALAARPNVQSFAIATALKAKPGLSAAGFARGEEVARFAVAIAEILHMREKDLPPMHGDRGVQAASSVIFGEVIDRVSTNRPLVRDLDDDAVMAFCGRAFDARSGKVAREVRNAA